MYVYPERLFPHVSQCLSATSPPPLPSPAAPEDPLLLLHPPPKVIAFRSGCCQVSLQLAPPHSLTVEAQHGRALCGSREG